MERQPFLAVRGLSVPLPAFYPSISTVKTNLTPVDYLQVLVATDQPQFLVSAYDLAHLEPAQGKKAERLLTKAVGGGAVVLMDSGNYESYWHRNAAWTPDRLGSALDTATYDLAFCFDDQAPPRAAESIVDGVEAAVLRDGARAAGRTVLPIVHAPREKLAKVARGVTERLYPVMLAVPERELGEGLLERAETVRAIRTALDETGQYCPLHLLGTGNPLSLLVYSACGADSFDGLEWCQTTVDHETGLLYHFQQRELLGEQTALEHLEGASYAEITLAHNLVFYRKWMARTQEALTSKTMAEFAEEVLPSRFLKTFRARMPGAL